MNETGQMQKTERKFGELTTSEFHWWKTLGDGETASGEKFDFGIVGDFSPKVYYKGKSFILPWRDIFELAELAGLFKDEVSA